MSVPANTPPVLTLPSDMTVQADVPGGWTAAYAVSATNAEDDPDPSPVCAPAVGDLVPLGTATVNCTATDSAGSAASGSFQVTVVDTTGPALHGMPGPMTMTTTDASGMTVSFTAPTATDIVDASPSVGCAPASGSWFAVGTTSVTCTATDASGNSSHASFDVSVALSARDLHERRVR